MEYQEAAETEPAQTYVKRALAEVVARATAPVVVLGGAHGTGKTTLVKKDPAFRAFHYVSLADDDVFAQASMRPTDWVASLPRPAIIDDAHLVRSLLPAAREAAPKKRGKQPAFVLVTAEMLHDDEGKGPKPARFTLFPFTQAELRGRTGCVVDDLFDGVVSHGFYGFPTRSDIRTTMRIGGFPQRALHPAQSLSQRQRSDRPFRDAFRFMGETDIGPDTSIDQLIEKSILEKVLASPGLVLGAEKLARSCYIDTATLSAHLEAMENQFIVHCLGMLDRPRGRWRAFTKTRVHPMDITFSLERLRDDGQDIAASPAIFSKMLRTLCVGQLVPAAQWASRPTTCHHWRRFDRRMREVDLVLMRDERLVGITVRNSLSARPDTIGALRFLAEDERFARGFIIYMGKFTRQLADNIWALPVSALWEEGAFQAEEASGQAMQQPQG